MTVTRLLFAITLAVLAADNAEGSLHHVAKAAARGTRARPPHAKHAKPAKAPSAATPSRAAGTTRLFPSLTSCSQKPDTTPFRVSPNATKAAPGSTWCFSITTAAPLSPDSPCGLATTLERIQLWASHDNRSDITSMSIRSEVGNRALYGSWANKGSREDPFRDELVFSKLDWTAAAIDTVKPHICLTLRGGVGLDSICQGPQGRCVIGLYSTGENGVKCCPVYVVLAE